MHRRRVLELVGAGTATALGAATVGAGRSAGGSTPAGVAWRSAYDDFDVAAAASAHDGGEVLVGRGRERSGSDVPVRIAVAGEDGAVRQRTDLDPEVPEEARRADADVLRTESGYAVAMGAWMATLDADLSVETTGFAAGHAPNGATHLTELPDGFVVASELDRPNHVSVRVFGFDDRGDLRWTREYGEDDSKWLEFSFPTDDGVVVGGRSPWLVGLAADGTERWRTTVSDAPSAVGYDAASDDGFALFGGSDAVRLDATSRSVEWRRSYESFRDAYGGEIARTADGGYVVAAKVTRDRFRVGRTDPEGRLRWSREYTAEVEGQADVTDLVERSPGEYLVVGSRRTGRRGWALLLSESETPTTEATAEITADRTTAPTTASTTATTADSSASAAIPGFGIGTALVGTAVGSLVRRYR